jgi:hypothetical protein
MRTADVDILIVPGLTGSGPDHWQSRWERSLSTARRIVQDDWCRPSRDAWVPRIVEVARRARRPAVLVAHSCGVMAAVHAAHMLGPGPVVGAFLVAPPSEAAMDRLAGVDPALLPYPREPLPFPSVVVASRSDPYCGLEEAGDLALAWGSVLADAGEAGHLNSESGHGPWPEGALRFGVFLKSLKPAAV